MIEEDPTPLYEFGGFRLDPARRRLFAADGQPISLTSRVFEVLLYFVEHHGELLEKATLMQVVWPDTIVEENKKRCQIYLIFGGIDKWEHY